MIARTSVERAYSDDEGFSNDIKIYPRNSRNYDISSEGAINHYDNNTIKVWRHLTPYGHAKFKTPALCTLIPDTATITEELNGTYEATFTTSIDDFKKYENIREFNFVRMLNDLFYIYKIDYNTTSSGTKITANCLHVTYLLKFLYCPNIMSDVPFPIQFEKADVSIDEWLCRLYANFLNYTKYASLKNIPINFADKSYYNQKFYLYSDIEKIVSDELLTKENPITIKPYDRSFIEVLLDKEDSFTSVLKGEIYRFNFHLSINEKKEDSTYNAYSLNIGADLSGIKRTVDYSKFCTDFKYEYCYPVQKEIGGELVDVMEFKTVSVGTSQSHGCPMPIYKTYFKEYEENPGPMVLYYAEQYFKKNYSLKVTYNVTFNAMSSVSDFSGLTRVSDIRVGDEGYINDIYFGETIKSKVTKIVRDGKTGEIKTAEFACSFDYKAQGNGVQYIDDDYIKIVSQNHKLWGDVKLWKWAETKQRTWKSLKGE